MKKLLLLFICVASFTAQAQNTFDLEVQVLYMLEERYVYYSDQNPEVADGVWIDELGISHRVYNSVEDIFKELDTEDFNISDNESRVFYVFSLELEQIKRGRSILLIDTKSREYKFEKKQF